MAPITPATPVSMGMIDHSGERTAFNFNLPGIETDGSNFDTLFAPATGSYDVLKATAILLTKLNLTKSTASIVVETSVGSLPAAASAQRETAARFTYVDNVTAQKYRFDIPSPVDAIIQTGTDVIDLGNALVAAFVADFESQCVSPLGNPVTVVGARLVGRRN